MDWSMIIKLNTADGNYGSMDNLVLMVPNVTSLFEFDRDENPFWWIIDGYFSNEFLYRIPLIGNNRWVLVTPSDQRFLHSLQADNKWTKRQKNVFKLHFIHKWWKVLSFSAVTIPNAIMYMKIYLQNFLEEAVFSLQLIEEKCLLLFYFP